MKPLHVSSALKEVAAHLNQSTECEIKKELETGSGNQNIRDMEH